MFRVQRSTSGLPRTRRLMAIASIGVSGVMLGACSAGVARLDNPSYGLQGDTPRPVATMGRSNAGAPPAYDNSGWGGSGPRDGAALPPPAISARPLAPTAPNTTVAALPDQPAPYNAAPYSPGVGASRPFDAPKKQTVAPVASSGEAVEVVSGDTLYGLSRRHNVSVADIMQVNGLTSAAIRPGQKLTMPSGARRPLARAPLGTQTASAGSGITPAVVAAPVAPAAASVPERAAPADWTGTHTVKSGESLYGIARQHKIKTADLQSFNGISDPKTIRPGTVLKVPSDGSEPAVAAAAPTPPIVPAAAPTTPRVEPVVASAPAAAPAASPGVSGVKVINAPTVAVSPAAPTKVAALSPAPAASASKSSGKFAWPVKGDVVQAFGKRSDGSMNDGINIAVPAGTDVMAADGGTVAYAGSELKGYGNLILVRHDNGWVSAYAHADQVMVKRGDAVKRGQVIAKAGKTGSVDKPQLHFELRQGSAPVDPVPHLEKN